MHEELERLQRAADVFLSGQRYDLAEKSLRELAAAAPSEPRTLAALALAVHGQRRHEEAEHIARSALTISPACELALWVLCRALHERGRFVECVEPAAELLRLAPCNPHYYSLMATNLHELGRDAEAIRAACAGLSIDPTQGSCLGVAAVCLSRIGRHEEAEPLLSRLFALVPSHEYACWAAGWSSYHAKDFNAAADWHRRGLAINPNFEWCHEGVGIALIGCGNLKGARKHLEEALRLNPALRRALEGLGQVSRVGGWFRRTFRSPPRM